MTLEKATKDMQALVAQHGFNYEGELTYDGRQIFTRRWTKKTQVVWYGESESILVTPYILPHISKMTEEEKNQLGGIPLVRIVRDGRREDKPRDYSSPKRAFNAIGEIVRCAGFEM